MAYKNKKVIFQTWGAIDYLEAWDKQEKIFSSTVQLKIENRNLDENEQVLTPNYLIFCEHPNVFTLGKSGKIENLLLNDKELNLFNSSFYKINRGGDITYHGPGQLVCYPILDLDNFFTDIHLYLRLLEQAVIQTLDEYNIIAGRIPGLTGVWINHENPILARKICAMGVRSSRWVTMHGLALNVNTDLNYFNHIVPCGINDKAVTSISKEIGINLDIKEVEQKLLKHICELFEMEIIK